MVIALARFGSGPMCCDNGTPGPACWGVPLAISMLRTLAGARGAPFPALERP